MVRDVVELYLYIDQNKHFLERKGVMLSCSSEMASQADVKTTLQIFTARINVWGGGSLLGVGRPPQAGDTLLLECILL